MKIKPANNQLTIIRKRRSATPANPFLDLTHDVYKYGEHRTKYLFLYFN